MGFFFGILLSVLAIFLILLVLVQRGRGGGLAGALGGMGGSSAFGAKAGDVFTRITIYVVIVWIVACILAGHWARNRRDPLTEGGATITMPEVPPLPQAPFSPFPPGTSAPPAGEPQLGSPTGDAAAKSAEAATKTEGAPAAKSAEETKSETPAAGK